MMSNQRVKLPQVQPLRWVPHSTPGNGWYGFTNTGAHIVYVHQPVDMRIKSGRYPWAVYQYWGANPDRCGNFGQLNAIQIRGEMGQDPHGEVKNRRAGKPLRFKTPRAAKIAAQAYWRRQVRALLK